MITVVFNRVVLFVTSTEEGGEIDDEKIWSTDIW
jgi:hypothetical protein